MDWVKAEKRKPKKYISVHVLKADETKGKALWNPVFGIWHWYKKEVKVTHWKYIPLKK